APADTRARPLFSYLFPAANAAALTRAVADRAPLGDSGWALPRAHHVLLSGCRSNETSKEVRHAGRIRGALSAALELALTSGGTGRTYRDVHRQVSANVRSLVRNQNPQLELSSDDDLDQPFLGGTIADLPAHFVVSRVSGEWTIDGGS